MALTDSSRIFTTHVQDMERILDYCKTYFTDKGYEVSTELLANGGFISLTTKGIFKTISGMNTGLNITLTQMNGAISVSMKIGLFGKQLVPTAITMLVFWPMLIPQIYGLVQQNKLDTEAYSVIEAAIRECEESVINNIDEDTAFCPFCGVKMPASANFCVSCGKRITEESTVCSKCGIEIPDSFMFCPNCGTPVEKETVTNS